MEASLLDLVDKINREQENAECAVLESMSAVYTKSFMIMEQTNDTSGFELFMESDNDEDKDDSSYVSRSRSQSVGAKFIRFLKRIWQQILTMVKRFFVDKKVKKYRKIIERYQTIPVMGGINDAFLDAQCAVMKSIIDSDIPKTDDIIKFFVEDSLMTETTKACKKINDEWDKLNEKNKNGVPITGHVSCRTMCDWIDTTLKYYDLFFIVAKNVDKYLDSNGQKADLEIMNDKSIDLKKLNNISNITFEQLRDNLSNFKNVINMLLELVQPKPAQVQVDDLTMSEFKRLMDGFLHSASAGSIQGGYVFNETTHTGETKNIMKSLEQIPEYTHVIKPIPSYEHRVIVTTYATNSEKNWLMKFYVIHCKTIDPKVEKMANEGTVIKL